MNKRVSGFISGVLTTAIAGSLGLTTLAATGHMTINVDPVNIQVNGQTFKPTDAKGAEVPVFAYNGTTYAPLRALAEAYGLEVGYDAAANMATVKDAGDAPSTSDTTAPSTDYSSWSKAEEAAYQEFKGMWEQKTEKTLACTYVTMVCDISKKEALLRFFDGNSESLIKEFSKRLSSEIYTNMNDKQIYTISYYCGSIALWDDLCGKDIDTRYQKDDAIRRLG